MTAPPASAAAPPSEPVIPRQPEIQGRRLAFRQPAPEELDQILSPEPSPTPESPEAGDGFGSGDPWDDESSPDSPAGTPSTASSSDVKSEKVDLFDEEDLTAIARAGVQLGGEKAHELLANTPGKQEAGLMLTDEKDQAQIGDPLARMAARHAGDVGGQVNPDTKDLLASLVGLASYGLKQINKVSEARRLDAGAGALAGSPQPMPQPADL